MLREYSRLHEYNKVLTISGGFKIKVRSEISILFLRFRLFIKYRNNERVNRKCLDDKDYSTSKDYLGSSTEIFI